MLLQTTLVALICTSAPPPVSVAAPKVNAVGVDAKFAQFVFEHFAEKLVENGFKVTTAREITPL